MQVQSKPFGGGHSLLASDPTTPADSSPPRGAYSIDEFCAAHTISRAHFHNLQKSGDGPAIFKAGKRTLISVEAARAWRQRLTEASNSRKAA